VVLNLFELAAQNFENKFGGTPMCKKEANMFKI
jgi:hypothetical protein